MKFILKSVHSISGFKHTSSLMAKFVVRGSVLGLCCPQGLVWTWNSSPWPWTRKSMILKPKCLAMTLRVLGPAIETQVPVSITHNANLIALRANYIMLNFSTGFQTPSISGFLHDIRLKRTYPDHPRRCNGRFQIFEIPFKPVNAAKSTIFTQ